MVLFIKVENISDHDVPNVHDPRKIIDYIGSKVLPFVFRVMTFCWVLLCLVSTKCMAQSSCQENDYGSVYPISIVPYQKNVQLHTQYWGAPPSAHDSFEIRVLNTWGSVGMASVYLVCKDNITAAPNCARKVTIGDTGYHPQAIRCKSGEDVGMLYSGVTSGLIYGDYEVTMTTNTTSCYVNDHGSWVDLIFYVSGVDPVSKECIYEFAGKPGYTNTFQLLGITLPYSVVSGGYYSCNGGTEIPMNNKQYYACPDGQNMTIIFDGATWGSTIDPGMLEGDAEQTVTVSAATNTPPVSLSSTMLAASTFAIVFRSMVGH